MRDKYICLKIKEQMIELRIGSHYRPPEHNNPNVPPHPAVWLWWWGLLLGGKDKQIRVCQENILPAGPPKGHANRLRKPRGTCTGQQQEREMIPWMEMAKASAEEGSGKPLGYFCQKSKWIKKQNMTDHTGLDDGSLGSDGTQPASDKKKELRIFWRMSGLYDMAALQPSGCQEKKN